MVLVDPLKDIEDRQDQKNLGKFVANIMSGALEETEDFERAFWVTVAYVTGTFSSVTFTEDEEDGT